MISCTYGATALAIYTCQITKIRIAIPDVNTIGNRIIFDDIVLVPSVPDTIPPTLTSYEDNKSNGNYSGAKSTGLPANADLMASIRLRPCLRVVER